MNPNIFLLLPACSLFLVPAAFAAEPSQKVEADVKVAVQQQAIALKVIPPAGTKLNFDGPWTLAIKGSMPMQGGSSVRVGKECFDRSTGSCTVPLSGQTEKGQQADYNLTYFICSKDESWCKRLTRAGTIQAGG